MHTLCNKDISILTMDSHYCDIEELLQECGLRSTKQKHRFVEAIPLNRPFSEGELRERLGSRWGNRTTFYRALSQLIKVEFLQRVFDDDGQTYYEHVASTHHDHLQCLGCKTYQCVPCAEPKTQFKKAKIFSHNLIFRGLCLKCLC